MAAENQFQNITSLAEPWWKTGIIYQIYPLSFQDTTGNGKGDLSGIRSRLDYVRDLGVTAIWLNPIYPSPLADCGYDISDYTAIHPWFGTMADFEALLADTHQRGLKLIMDFVPNHTSDQHPWFLESRSGRDNPKRGWYIWRDARPEGGPPNNWVSFFGGPAWEWDETSGQYYLHLFAKEQPDLNWRNPEVVQTMEQVLRFWLDKGVDGFRVDVIWLMIKDGQFRDEPPNPDWEPGHPLHQSLLHVHTQDQPETHALICHFRRILEEYGDKLLYGELHLPYPRLVSYYGTNLEECHLPLNSRLIHTPFKPSAVRQLIKEYQYWMPEGAWPNWALGNHDEVRPASPQRCGAGNARLAQMMLLTLRGTPICYYGDELGMPDVDIPIDRMSDPQALNEPGVAYSRDRARTPMQWNDSPFAGFSSVEPWMPVAEEYRTRNVAAQLHDPTSFLNLFKSLTHLRQSSNALMLGEWLDVEPDNDCLMVYVRQYQHERMLVALNFDAAEHRAELSHVAVEGTILLSTELDRFDDTVHLASLVLRPHEGLILRLE